MLSSAVPSGQLLNFIPKYRVMDSELVAGAGSELRSEMKNFFRLNRNTVTTLYF
jgi:hypothetical protein